MKIGVLLSRVPYPLEKGDKLRAFHQIRELSKKHEIYLCALNVGKIHSNAIEKISPYCKEIKIIKLHQLPILFRLIYSLIFTKLPLQLAYFFQKKSKQDIQDYFIKNEIDHIYCQLIRVSEYIKDLKSIPRTLDYMDALSRGMERRIEKSPLLFKPFVKLETKRLKSYEHFIFNEFDHKTIISEQDRHLITHAKNQRLEVIRNGVDQQFFKPLEKEKKYDLLFTGNMSYPPNVDGVCFLIEKVMPLVWKAKADTKVAIVGANPNQVVRGLAGKNVIITGWVDDIRMYYAASKIFIAPMQIGTGLQNKLLEAMAMKIPSITSTLANNALRAEHNKNILIADSPEQFSQSAIELLEKKEKRDQIATEGLEFVKENYNWKNTTEKLEALFLKTK